VNFLLMVISPNPPLRNLVFGDAFVRFLDWVQLIFRLPSSQLLLCRASEPVFLSKSNNSSIHWFTLPHYFFLSAKKERGYQMPHLNSSHILKFLIQLSASLPYAMN
jgi:hypothetical protein